MNHQYSGRGQKSRGVKAKHVLLAILILVMGFWSLFQIKHSGYKLLIQKLKDGSLGRKGLVEPIDVGNVIVEITNLEESGTGDEDAKDEDSRAEELYKELLFRSVDNSTGVDSFEAALEDAGEAERPNGENGYEDENGVPPEGNESAMSVSDEPRISGLSEETVDDADNRNEEGTNTTEKSVDSDTSNESDDNAGNNDKDLNVDRNYDENLATQK